MSRRTFPRNKRKKEDQVLQANEMKVQVLNLDTMEEFVSFFNELDKKKELCSRLVLFFNELETKNKH